MQNVEKRGVPFENFARKVHLYRQFLKILRERYTFIGTFFKNSPKRGAWSTWGGIKGGKGGAPPPKGGQSGNYNLGTKWV